MTSRWESADLLAMPLDRFVHESQFVEVTLWFVPEERDANMLAREGVDRRRVWTAPELMGLITAIEWWDSTVNTVIVDG